MAGRRRKAAELARDRRRIAELYLRGWLQVDIADELGLHQTTISNDLKAIQAEWLESTIVDFDKARARELAKIDDLEREYWCGWQESTKDREIDIEESQAGGKHGSLDKTVHKVEGQVGDPRFLQGVQSCIDRRCKLLGLDAPTKVAPTDPTGSKEYTGLPDDERISRVVELLDRARTRRAEQPIDA